MTTVRRDDLIAALRLRYDHFSAHAVLEAALARAALPDQATYDGAQVQALRAALARVGDRLGAVDAQLDALAGGAAPPGASSPTSPKPPEPEPEPRVKAKEPAPPVKEPERVKAKEPATSPAPAPTAAPAGPVTIGLEGLDAADGAQVLVCGGAPQLGDWDPERALAMARDGGAWTATVELPAGSELSFKFLVRHPDGAVEWEAGDNRVATVAPRIVAAWRTAP